MQFQQQPPHAILIAGWKIRSAHVSSLFDEGRGLKNVRRLRQELHGLIREDRQRQAMEQPDPDVFSDWQLAFDYLVAITRLQPEADPWESHMVDLLGQAMYATDHWKQWRLKGLTFLAATVAIVAFPAIWYTIKPVFKRK